MSHRDAPLHLCKISLSIFLFKVASSSLPAILEIGAAINPGALCTILPSKWPWDISRNTFFFFLPLLYHPYSSCPSLGRLLICLHPANSAPWHLSCSYLSSVSTGSLRKLTSAPPFALDSNPAPPTEVIVSSLRCYLFMPVVSVRSSSGASHCPACQVQIFLSFLFCIWV